MVHKDRLLDLECSEERLAAANERAEANEKDAARYRWLFTDGPTYQGAMSSAGSMPPARGPYVLLEPPSLNQFSNMILNKQGADSIIDAAMQKEESK